MENLGSYIYGISIIKMIFDYVLPVIFLLLGVFVVIYLKNICDYVRYIARNVNSIVENEKNK